MSFEQRLRKTVEPVEKALSIYLGTVSLANKGVPERLADAMRHAVLDAGKRLRPFLVMASADACGFEHRAVCQVAAAVELIHCYSLVHDDLPAMDNDTVRRGRPSVWAAFDEHTAILAGDGLLTMAFELLT
ncbi:MAG: hypothetical protein RLZ98_3428, partial [Pseudomonadota bacterium]